VGAISVHGVNGLFGVLAVGIFADGSYGAGWNLTTNNGDGGVQGVLYGLDNIDQLAAQAIGALVIMTVIFGVAFTFFKIQNALTKGGIRSEEEDEIAGLDLPEMGVLAYPEFGRSFDLAGTVPHGTPTAAPAGAPVGSESTVR
jgi:ammonium transporter, Amt family